jgi:RNA polymerase sigma-70 factor (ECF subfamily)
MKNKTETQLTMESFAQDPEKGFELIYKNYSGPIFRYLRNSFRLSREEAEDVLQNVFMPWVQSPEKFATITNPCSYLFASARNAAIKLNGKAKEQTFVEEAGDKSETSHDSSIEANILILEALEKLPNEQKEAVILKVWIHMTFDEIAELQKCTLQTAASRYRYAIAKLKELIQWQD